MRKITILSLMILISISLISLGCVKTNANIKTEFENNNTQIQELEGTENKTICIEAFTSPTCPHCHDMKRFINKLKEQYPNIVLIDYEGQTYNKSLRATYNKRYSIPSYYAGSVPFIVVGDTAFLGSSQENKDRISNIISEAAKNGGLECTYKLIE